MTDGRLFEVWDARPVLKWPGGKRRLVKQIVYHFPQEKVRCYWEPFFGGGAVFFSARCDSQAAVLSDMNERLMNTYIAIRDCLPEVEEYLRAHVDAHSQEHYYLCRDDYNKRVTKTESAAALLYLNRAGYNGVYRENGSGGMNVPWGHTESVSIDWENLKRVSRVLAREQIELCVGDYGLTDPGEGDVVYCDPPYHETFTQYHAGSFSEDDQTALRDAAVRWMGLGATVLISNSDTEFIRSIYKDGFEMHPVYSSTVVGQTGESRGSTIEVLAVGRP